MAQDETVDTIRSVAVPFNDISSDLTQIIQELSTKEFILLGGASHGTQEFCQARIEITKQLILHHKLSAIAIEGDWPSAYRVNCYVRWQSDDNNANEALSDFKRFPLWMWRNTLILDFVVWLRNHNKGLPVERQVGFYGLDMYSMYESIGAVIDYLDQVDPEAGKQARIHYECLDHMGGENQYGYGVALGYKRSCESDVIAQLVALREKAISYVADGDMASEDDQFQAEQNARLISDAEAYYRQLFDPRINTWTLRDVHMKSTLDDLHEHLSKRLKNPAKIAVWAHNTHVGDARATELVRRSQQNLGQLVRESYTHCCALLGLMTYSGIMTAATRWNAPAQRMLLRPAIDGAVEELLHATELKQFYLALNHGIADALDCSYLTRAIGVTYQPEIEEAKHYLSCRLTEQYDGLLFIDETRALEPLDPTSEWLQSDVGLVGNRN